MSLPLQSNSDKLVTPFRCTLKKVVFLDRDGVINRDSPDYIKSWAEFEFLPKSIEAIKDLTIHGFAIIIITNQSVINRKMVSTEELVYIHNRMRQTLLSSGGLIKDIFYCPHTPEDECSCRKPKPGLIDQAQKKYNIDRMISQRTYNQGGCREVTWNQHGSCNTWH